MNTKKHGLIKAETCDKVGSVHVYLDDVDVTKFCVAANDIEGWAEVLENDGKDILSLECERKSGNVLIVIDE